MWAWIYYTCITFGALAFCSTVTFIQIMATENTTESINTGLKERKAPKTSGVDIEEGLEKGDMHHRKSQRSSGLHF